jgi:integrase
MERWLHDSAKGSVKPIPFEQYRRQTRLHRIPVLGSSKLPKLTPANVQSPYQRKLDEGLSPTFVRYIHAVINRALKQALRWRLVRENVAAATDPPKSQTKTMSSLDAEQAKRFLGCGAWGQAVSPVRGGPHCRVAHRRAIRVALGTPGP